MLIKSLSSLPKRRFTRLACLLLSIALLSASLPLLAQSSSLGTQAKKPSSIQNNSFDQGAAGWTWKRYFAVESFASFSHAACNSRPLQQWQPPAANFPNAGGRTYAALGYGSFYFDPSNPGEYLVCSEASQLVTLPSAPRDIVFDYKLGTLQSNATAPTTTFRAVTLQLVVEPTNGSPAELVFSDTGSSLRANIHGGCTAPPGACPEWKQGRASLTRFAGQTVRLRFVSGSSEERQVNGLSKVQSSAFLDEINLVDGPLPQVSITADPSQVLVPSDRGGTTMIRWNSQHVYSLAITVAVDGAPATAFASSAAGGPGSQAATWIQRGRSYLFRAVGSTYPGGPLQTFDQVVVQGVAPPTPSATLQANPAELHLEPGTTGTSVISWTHQNLASLDVFVSVDGAPETPFAGGLIGGPASQPATWIQPGHTYLFRAIGRDLAGSPPQEVARTTVRGIEINPCGNTVFVDPSEGWYTDDVRPNTAMQISPRGDFLIFGWLTYGAGGHPVWYFGQPERDECGRFVGTIDRYQRDPSTGDVTSAPVGEISLGFTADGLGEALYGFGNQSRTTTLTYFQFGSGVGSLNLTGFYADATRSHSGSYLISQGDTHLLANYIFDAGGQPVWTMGWGPDNGMTIQDLTMEVYSGTGRCPLCDGTLGPLTSTIVGTVDLYPQGNGMMLFNGNLSGAGLEWDWFWTSHGRL